MKTQLENTVFPLLPCQHKDWLIGLSGGVDSVVLLKLCAEFISLHESDISLYAVHLNHQTRGEDSDHDEMLCHDLCSHLGIELFSKSLNIPQFATGNKQNFEEAARETRHRLFLEAALQFELTSPALLLAHHQNDNIETILMRLLRGSSMRGLHGISYSSILPVYNHEQKLLVTIYRPLLHTPKRDILAYARENNLVWREDKSNYDTTYTRNLLRNIVLPALQVIDPEITTKLHKLAETAAQTESLIQAGISNIKYQPYRLRTTIDEKSARTAEFSVFCRLVEALCAKIIPNFLLPGNAYRSLKRLHTAAVAATDIARGLHIALYDGNFYIYQKDSRTAPINFQSYADNFHYEDSNMLITITKTSLNGTIPEPYDPFVEYIPATFTQAPLQLATVNLNTKITPIGIKGSQKLKRILQNYRVPPHLRTRIPVLLYDNTPLWIAGVILCEHAKLHNATGEVFCLRYSEKTL